MRSDKPLSEMYCTLALATSWTTASIFWNQSKVNLTLWLFLHACIPLINNSNDCIQRRSSRFFTISLLCHELSPTRTLKQPRRIKEHGQVHEGFRLTFSCKQYWPLLGVEWVTRPAGVSVTRFLQGWLSLTSQKESIKRGPVCADIHSLIWIMRNRYSRPK